MTQEERWITRYKEVVNFIEANHRNPSKYAQEEKLIVHFGKRGRKAYECWRVEEIRQSRFKEILTLVEDGNE